MSSHRHFKKWYYNYTGRRITTAQARVIRACKPSVFLTPTWWRRMLNKIARMFPILRKYIGW